MQLPTRSMPYDVPQYSLTGDIVANHRCGLQYRYYNRSSLPPSRPVQLWTGEFVHGLMEEAYLYWQTNPGTPFPWSCNITPWASPPPTGRLVYDIGTLGDNVEARLRSTGKEPRNRAARSAAYRRVDAAVNKLAPHLFPLITSVEEKVSSTRVMPTGSITPPPGQQVRADRYELTGRVDVISSVSLALHTTNPLVGRILAQTAGLSGDFDVIMDYKAARRPPTTPPPHSKSLWTHEALQVQLYAWLRAQQPNTLPVKAGILIYINELAPSQEDLKHLQDEVQHSRTDVMPPTGSPDYYALFSWHGGNVFPTFSDPFLLERAIRIVPVDAASINAALAQIDSEVAQIEQCVLQENASGDIPSNWQATGDNQDCDACDFRRFCPSPAWMRRAQNPAPRVITAPG